MLNLRDNAGIDLAVMCFLVRRDVVMRDEGKEKGD
jgi:hypothetical protein